MIISSKKGVPARAERPVQPQCEGHIVFPDMPPRTETKRDRPYNRVNEVWRPFPFGADPHPKSGYHYIHVIGSPWPFWDEYAVYRAAAAQTPWMSFVCRDFFDDIVKNKAWREDGNFWIIWSGASYDIPPRSERASKIGLYYNEACFGNPDEITGFQNQYQRQFERNHEKFDMTWADTPRSVDFIRQWTPKCALAPVGYDPCIGIPDWNTPKRFDIGYYGTLTGRRSKIWPALKAHFGNRMTNLTGLWGPERAARMDECRANLHISHSYNICGSSLRVWQAVSSSAALIKEVDDAWPAEPGKHYLEIPRFEDTSARAVIDAIENYLKGDLVSVARNMYDDMSQYTVTRAMDEYFVPASMRA